MPGFEILGKEERKAVNKVFDEGGILFAHGFKAQRKKYHVREFERDLAKKFKCKFALPVSNGTSAIKIALKSLNVGINDEVITQSFNFIATVEAIVDLGAKPIICNIDETLNMDINDLEKKITKKTKAIVPVHMLGASCDMKGIISVAKKYNIPVVEDNCEAVGGTYDKKFLGTLGDIGVMSFDFAKIITTGEGGAILTNKKKLYTFCKEYHDHGHQNNLKYARGNDSSKNSGFNYRITELQAAIGKVQLKKLNFILSENNKRYQILFQNLHQKFKIRKIVPKTTQNYETFIIIEKNKIIRRKIIKLLNSTGFGTRNLPDALKWHCSFFWERAVGKTEAQYSKKAYNLLQECIAIPMWLKKSEKEYKFLSKKILETRKI